MSFLSFFRRSVKVLIVEDDALLRRALAEKCKEHGYTALESSEANDVLAILAKEKPDALVLDLILPMKDGVSLLEEVRGSGFTLPVVILSNLQGSDELRADAARLDAVFYNKASVSLDEILQALERKI